MGISLTGVQATIKANMAVKVKTEKKIAEGLRECAESVLRASQKLVPVDTKLLKDSGHVETNGKAGAGAEARVVYDTPYAIYVHEDMNAYHEPPTQARFLTDAIPKVRGTMTNILKRKVLAGVRDGRDIAVRTTPEKEQDL